MIGKRSWGWQINEELPNLLLSGRKEEKLLFSYISKIMKASLSNTSMWGKKKIPWHPRKKKLILLTFPRIPPTA